MSYPQYNYPAFGGYNPITPYAPRMEAPQGFQQPTQPAQQPQSVATPPSFVCRPVASREEAMAIPVDFMGNPMFFPDLAHGVIYVKRFNTQTGSADLFEYYARPAERRTEGSQDTVAFAPLNDLMDLKDTVDQLRKDVDGLKKPAKAVKKSNDADE